MIFSKPSFPRPQQALVRILPILALSIFPAAGTAQASPILTWQGEIRPRLLGREPVDGRWDQWISMRSRLALDARLQGGLGVFLQIQDVRFWGEELSNRDASADAVDFHQAYLEVDSLPGIGGLVRAGRQEVELGEARFIGAPDWGQAGQTFDGVRWIRPAGNARANLVYLRLREGSADTHDGTAEFLAGSASLQTQRLGSVELLGIHDWSEGPRGNSQSTTAVIWTMRRGPLSGRVQGAYQFGERTGEDLSAYMIAFRGTLDVREGKGGITLWYDHLSGDAEPMDGEVQSFSTLFGARHRYYGRADYFLDIPDDTGGLGLGDAALKLAYDPTPLLSINLDLHTFRTTARGDLPSRHLADEADLWIQHRFREALALEVGYSLIWAGSALEALDRLEGTGNVAYFMTSLRF